MEGVHALHFLFKPNYFGNFAQNIIDVKQNSKKQCLTVMDIREKDNKFYYICHNKQGEKFEVEENKLDWYYNE